MAKIVPFRALRYASKVVTDLQKVMAPPYDVISPTLQEALYARSPHNIIRLILGRTSADDNDNDNRYTRAADDFARWQADGVLVRDVAPAIYLYDQDYILEDGTAVCRKGFIALTRIEDFSSGVVKPHEKTLAGPKADRLQLTKACSANFSPIFSLYADPCCVIESFSKREKERTPEIDVADDDGVRHRLWCATVPELIDKARELLDSKPLFIADGHHRYETALNYRNLRRASEPGFNGRELYNYVLMYFANMEDQGMLIFPTHRLLHGLANFQLESLLSGLREHFTVDTQPIDPSDAAHRRQARQMLAEKGKSGHAIACYAGGKTLYYLTLKDEAVMNRFFDVRAPKALRTLDVSILHRLILENLLSVSLEAQEQQTNLKYVKGFDDPFELVQKGECQLAFLMNPTRMSEVRDVANAGEKMPQKSTYFYPKLLSGLVVSKIFTGETVVD